MGLAGSDNNNPQEVLQLWGADPVHPMETAYTKMAEKIMDEVNVIGVVNSRVHHIFEIGIVKWLVVRKNGENTY